MKRKDAEKLLERFRYKDNFTFRLPKRGPLIIRMTVRDSVTRNLNTFWLPMEYRWLETPGQFFNILFNHILSIEMHEAKEWFRVDGKQLFEPHPQVT